MQTPSHCLNKSHKTCQTMFWPNIPASSLATPSFTLGLHQLIIHSIPPIYLALFHHEAFTQAISLSITGFPSLLNLAIYHSLLSPTICVISSRKPSLTDIPSPSMAHVTQYLTCFTVLKMPAHLSSFYVPLYSELYESRNQVCLAHHCIPSAYLNTSCT